MFQVVFFFAILAVCMDCGMSGGMAFLVALVGSVIPGIVLFFVGMWREGSAKYSPERSVAEAERREARTKWKFKTGDHVNSSPAVSDGVVYFGSHDSYLYALDARPSA